MSEGKVKVRLQSNLDFRLMSLAYKIRDFRQPRIRVLEEVGIKAGFQILDYGCGPGSYITPLVKLVGKSGKIYALDVHPLAIKVVQRLASRKGITNVQVILSDCDTGLSPASIDVVLLYDIIHDLENRTGVLTELHRVLKPEGILSVSDHHLKENEIISRVIRGGLFKFKSKGKRTFSFLKEKR
jgi:ubiquinone/menaquinone biosynthesis C-methylase UbiE